MNSPAIVLFDNGTHKVLCFDQLVTGDGVQSNQFLIIDHDEHALLDPGGDLTYMPLSLAVSRYIALQELTYVFASHQDPDIIASLDKWFLHTRCRVVCSRLWARFLHSVGNLQFFDPISGILFSGDMGASMVDDAEPVTDFAQHKPHMESFHRRYMAGNKACRLWANMIRGLQPKMIVPQHGRPFVGPDMINAFLDWISQLECGLDLLTQADYRIP